MAKFYVVKVGRKPGIYKSWEECKEQVDKFSGAVHKSFGTYKQAMIYLHGSTIRRKNEARGTGTVDAYVDGSYNEQTLKAGYGCVIIEDDLVIKELKGVLQLKVHNNSRNINGEVRAAIKAIEWAVDNNYENITIFYDYLGIEKWITGDWEARVQVSIDYVIAVKALIKKINIDFRKVKAHSGNEYNERADLLAKQAIGIK